LPNGQIIMNIVAGVAAFGLLAGLWVAVLLMVSLRRASRQQAVEERLGGDESARTSGPGRVLRLWHEGHVATMTVPSVTSPSSWIMRLRWMHRAAGFEAEFKAVLLGVAGLTLLCGALAYAASHQIVLAVGAGAAVLVGFWWYIQRRIASRDMMFENQFIDAMGLASRSLRAGHPLLGAFQLISEELGDPVRSLFTGICQQHAMGLKLDEAIQRVAATSTNTDVQLFATAVTIQLRSGGNLADVMERLAEVIRDRVRVGRRAKVLTAQTQFSKRLLIALPCVLFLILYLVNPQYMRPLMESHGGRVLLAIGATSLTLGVFVMNKMAVLKY
jgi:tight adherence protein B